MSGMHGTSSCVGYICNLFCLGRSANGRCGDLETTLTSVSGLPRGYAVSIWLTRKFSRHLDVVHQDLFCIYFEVGRVDGYDFRHFSLESNASHKATSTRPCFALLWKRCSTMSWLDRLYWTVDCGRYLTSHYPLVSL